MHSTVYALPLLSAALAVAAASSEPKPISLVTRPKLNKHRKHHKNVKASGAVVTVANAESKRDRALARTVAVDSNIFFVTVPVTIGVQPASSRDMLVDTGSAPFVVNSPPTYQASSATKPTNYTAKFAYGTGAYGFNAAAFTDDVRIGEVALHNYHYLLNVTSTFGGYSLGTGGLLGLAPDLGNAKVIMNPDGTYRNASRTFLSAAYHQRAIPKNMAGFYNEPTLQLGKAPLGQMTLGGVDSSLYCGKLTKVPKSSDPLALKFWSVETTFEYNGKNLPIQTQNGTTVKRAPMTVDTGSGQLYMPSTAFQSYVNATGLQYDANSDFWYVPNDKLKSLRDLDIIVNNGKTVLPLSPAAQIYPPGVSSQFIDPKVGQASTRYYAAVEATSDNGAQGNVYFAETKWTYAQTSGALVNQSPKAKHAACKPATVKGKRCVARH